MAEVPGPLLTVVGCARRLPLGESAVRGMLRAHESDPCHLPSVFVPLGGRGGGGYRIRPEELEQLVVRISTPAPLPADAIRAHEAIALLAGKRLQTNSTAYIRHQGRLARGAKHGRLTEYRLLGPGAVPRHSRYYSRAEVLALRDSLERDGFTPAAAPHKRAVGAIIQRAEREGLISLEAGAELAGVTIAAARRWTQQGRFGARKIDGLWFFDRAKVAAYRRPAIRQPHETVPCAFCGGDVTRTASRIRKAREVAAVAGYEDLLVFCEKCWANEPEARSLAHSRCVWRRGYSSPGRSGGMKAQWADGKRDGKAQGERMSKVWRSPKTAVERAEKSTLARYGHPLSDPRQVERNARGRGQAATARSASTRELEAKVAELWPTDMTQMEIAHELHVTQGRVAQIARKRGLPPRGSRGRPRANY
jgi:hypothetical protein